MTMEATQQSGGSADTSGAAAAAALMGSGTASTTIDATGDAITTETKIDPVTQVQDTIDSLSLSLFEALRGLRDHTAPDSLTGDASQPAPAPTSSTGVGGNVNTTSGSGGSQSDEPDYEDFLVAYHNKEPHAVAVVDRAGGEPPKSREEYVRLLARMEMESDVSLVTRLAGGILVKSREVDDLVDGLPGMDRNKDEQLAVIERLIEENKVVDEELESKYREAIKKRDEVRATLARVTCSALGIEEEL
eukprot:CAMPEP_0178510750 /NCGR_PEP_ID=MMETSP0696-20121128/22000_1 /TAXON_ID=265572 /ORGANISM="Extubocellulus spinifer, Strain CCMP396" /LENGTH=246 /DNA_ID=CAMNT_0020140487 /DNA_START=62 /DNA_END=799 /DNA_ORIENTATION=+